MKIVSLFSIYLTILVQLGGCIPLEQNIQRQSKGLISPFVRGTLNRKVTPAMAYLEMTGIHGKPISYGWGIFVSPIHIVTNLHVVAWTAAGTAKYIDHQNEFSIQGIVAIDEKNDLVLLKVNNPNFKPIHLADNNSRNLGDTVYLILCPSHPIQIPFFYGSSINSIVKNEDNIYTMTVKTSPVNIGSCQPVLNRKGRLIGVTSPKHIDGENTTYVIPSEYIKKLRQSVGSSVPLSETKIYISAETYYKRGNTKLKLRLFSEAISDYDTAIHLRPNFVEAYQNRGLSKANLGKTTEAEKDLLTALNLTKQSGNIELQNKIESVLLKLKK